MKITHIPPQLTAFYHWWFKHYSDNDTCSRYRHYDDMAEYGISSVEYLAYHTEDAVKDAIDYFDRNPNELDNMFHLWEQDLINQKLLIMGRLEDIATFKKLNQ